jgi:YfiH family protein
VAVRRRFTDRSHGDLHIGQDPAVLAERRAAIVDIPWVWLRQVHGADVVTVTSANAASVAGTEADAAVTAEPGIVLAIHTADCVPVLLTSSEGVVGAAHAGWRGIEAGVVGATIDAMRALGATDIHVELGPYIFVECYEFGSDDLDRLERTVGAVRGATDDGQPALDLQMAVLAALDRADDGEAGSFAGGPLDEPGATCTACTVDTAGAPRWFSHRARGDTARQAMVVRLAP